MINVMAASRCKLNLYLRKDPVCRLSKLLDELFSPPLQQTVHHSASHYHTVCTHFQYSRRLLRCSNAETRNNWNGNTSTLHPLNVAGNLRGYRSLNACRPIHCLEKNVSLGLFQLFQLLIRKMK